jgi:hypothetical protein
MDMSNPTLIPTSRPPGYSGDHILSQNALDACAGYYLQRPVYGPPSMISATGIVREKGYAALEFYTHAPERNQYDHVVVWLGKTDGKYAAPPNIGVATQRARTFGGYGPPYYQNLQAPSLSEVARRMGGVVNGR